MGIYLKRVWLPQKFFNRLEIRRHCSNEFIDSLGYRAFVPAGALEHGLLI